MLHGGDDLNAPANNVLTAYRASGPTGNDEVKQEVAPRLDNYFPPPTRPRGCGRSKPRRLRERMIPGALDVIVGWTVRVLGARR